MAKSPDEFGPEPAIANMTRLPPVIDAAIGPISKVGSYDITPSSGRLLHERADDTALSYDISEIDFQRPQQEFTKRPTKRTDVQTLKEAIDPVCRP